MFPFVPILFDMCPRDLRKGAFGELQHHQNKELNILNKPSFLLGAFAASVMLWFLLETGYISWSKPWNTQPQKEVKKQRIVQSRIPERKVSKEQKKKATELFETVDPLENIGWDKRHLTTN